MKRLGITITEEQIDWLSQQRQKRGLSISEILRRLIDEEMEQYRLRMKIEQDMKDFDL